MIYLTLILGFGLLMLCGDLLVRGSVGMAARFGVAPLIIALTIVAVGTSLPELFISADATLQGAPGLALGNIIGSNISNILLVLGLPALIYPIACSGLNLPANAWVMLASSFMLTVLCFLGPIARGEGALLLVMFVLFLSWTAMSARTHRIPGSPASQTRKLIQTVEASGRLAETTLERVIDEPVPTAVMSWLVIAMLLLVGLAGLPLGAHLVVTGGTSIARAWSVPENIIGLTLIALGTSLPELSTSLMAAWRQQSDIAIGNVIGSNIVNVLMVIGMSSLIAPIPVAQSFLHVDLWIMLLTALAILPVIATRGSITRLNGAIFVLAYAIYLISLLQRAGSLI